MKDILKYGLPWIIFIALVVVGRNLLSTEPNGWMFLLLFGLLVIYYFLLDNPEKSWSKPTVVAFVFWLISLQVRREYHEHIGSWLPALMAALLVFIYFQRFKSREDKHWVDYLKMIGVMALLPATYFESVLSTLIAAFLAFIYLLDRLIIRRQMNKTTQIITFSLMGLICISFLIYSFIKADEAEKAHEIARIAQKEAEKQRNEAMRMQVIAEESAEEARRQAALAAQALADCESSK